MVRRIVTQQRSHQPIAQEQFWPVFAAVVSLSVLSIAATSAYLQTDDPRWYANSWWWCFATLGFTLVSLILLRLQSRWVRPSMQLAGVLCLLVHAVLLVISVETNIFGRLWEELVAARQKLEERERLVEPDYRAFQTEQQRERHMEVLREPVDARTPDAPSTYNRAESNTQVASSPISPRTTPEEHQVTPSLLEMQQVEQSVPRFSTERTRISRADARLRKETADNIAIPVPRPLEQQQLADSAAMSNRARTTTPSAASPISPSPDAPRRVSASQPNRRSLPAPELTDNTASLDRSQPIPRRLAPEMIELAENSPQETREQRELAPARMSDDRRQPDSAPDRPEIRELETQPRTLASVPGLRSGDAQPDIASARATSTDGLRRPTRAGPQLPTEVQAAEAGRSRGTSNELSEHRMALGNADRPSRETARGVDSLPTTSAPNEQAAATGRSPLEGLSLARPRAPSATSGTSSRTRPSGGSRRGAGVESDTSVPLTDLIGDRGSLAATDRSAEGNPPAETLSPSERSQLDGERSEADSLAVELPAASDPGGLQSGIELDPGIRNRRASRESPQVVPQANRFRRRRVTGPPAPEMDIVTATEPFRQRSARLRTRTPPSDEAAAQTERAIELGLAYLARVQRPDGSWSLRDVDPEVNLSSETAATGLALLAFQGAGYSHREHRYANVVREGIDYLKRHQLENGDLFKPLDDNSNRTVWLYSHGIAALALSEAYGMTQDASLQDSAQRAIDFVEQAQDQRLGGWRYSPGASSDSSVSGWMVMALKSAQLAQLDVSEESISLSRKWFDFAQASDSEPHLYRYNPFAPDTDAQRHGRLPSRTMTAVGLLMRLYDGWSREDAAMLRGAEYLAAHLPAEGTANSPLRDTYYWYYGTQVMFHMQGQAWESWRDALRPLLIDTQVQEGPLAGSWEAAGEVPDRWAYHAGRLYVTTLNLLSLEVQYRHLPLYIETAR